ncbi:FmdB family zinc ribbon protein [Thermodesulfatator atlanticus]|uniref:FmdB family zinc ribbon protein n=1 Tax=Thermodesulfatator atlanticus TaxID=501497 RepID=UPI0003B30C53|nr:zinc ribbon domain-containing protein [Thermodesulfatator atlanticus]
MPIYEFVCKDCRHIFENLCFTEQDVKQTRCKRCGSKNVSKLVSTFSSRVGAGSGGSFSGGFSGGSTCGGLGGFS